MIDRVLKGVIAALFACLLLQVAAGIVSRALQVVVVACGTGLRSFGSILGSLLGVLLLGLLAVGLFVRGVDGLRRRDPRAARRQVARERVRTRARHPAEGVPVEHAPTPAEDPDPALGADEEEGAE